MDHFKAFQTQTLGLLLGAFLLVISAVVGGIWWLSNFTDFAASSIFIITGLGGFILSLGLTVLLSNLILQPIQYAWQAILHVTRENTTVTAPNIEQAKVGRQLLTSLTQQVYKLAQHADTSEGGEEVHANRPEGAQALSVVGHFPLPLFVFNKDQQLTNASDSAISYCGTDKDELFGAPLYETVKLEFGSEHTLDAWIRECQETKVTDTMYWERVRLRPKNDEKQLRQFDMAAHYNRDNPTGAEFIVTMFDRTERYNQDDKSLSFVALAVHELRTPLTVLRGYIEVFEDELADKLDGELSDFMHKMRVSASQLTAFVNNILNVARIEENQLVLRLSEEDWSKALRHAIDDMTLKAKVHGKELSCTIDPGLPSVAVDRISIYEVINNLIDNAIKYSGESNTIVIRSGLGKDGMIETTVQDGGIGIPESVLPNIFEKFYRNHRTRSQIGGTGLGLYLCKAIVSAHGGQIWARSKEGEGSIFGFSLQPYTQLADELKEGDNKDIIRSSHGWIKNHSLYRR